MGTLVWLLESYRTSIHSVLQEMAARNPQELARSLSEAIGRAINETILRPQAAAGQVNVTVDVTVCEG